MVSLTEHNTNERSRSLLDATRESVVALVSDAGTPGVSDPGARLVEDAHEAGITVVAIPGPSALAAAISVAGFGAASVRFLGFLPRQRGERLRLLKEEGAPGSVLVLFESPNRLGDTLGELAELFANPEVGVCRELTKVHEEVVRGRAAELGPRFASTRGECTVVFRIPAAEPGANDGAELRAYMEEMQRAGARRSAAAVEAARRFGVTREAAYECWRET